MSRQNHNANYIYDVDGETVWEKLRVIRSMLNDRRRSYQHALLAQESTKNIDTDSIEYKRYLIDKDFNESLIQDCANEVKFLEEFEKYLASEAEKTRIAGKTDDEMYELNFFYELEVRLVRQAQAQIAASGHIGSELMLRLMKNKGALNICVQQGLLAPEIDQYIETPLLPSSSVHTSDFIKYKQDSEHD
jgi:hypothetical protein